MIFFSLSFFRLFLLLWSLLLLLLLLLRWSIFPHQIQALLLLHQNYKLAVRFLQQSLILNRLCFKPLTISATIIHRFLSECDSDFAEIVGASDENIKSGQVSFGFLRTNFCDKISCAKGDLEGVCFNLYVNSLVAYAGHLKSPQKFLPG